MDPVEQRKKRARIQLLSSLIFLVIIWIWKFSHPQYTILPSSVTQQAPKINTIAVEKPGPKREKWHDLHTTSADDSTGGAGSSISTSDSKIVQGSKAAVIIQPGFRQNVIPLILHFAIILGPSWQVYIYTNAESSSAFTTSAALKRYLNTQIEIRVLPQTSLIATDDDFSAFMANSWLWESLAPAEHVLMFDSDSMICGNAARSVDDYLEYAFIGAPIKETLGKGFNGGLSLRRRSVMIRVLNEWDFEGSDSPDRFEDQWFYNRLLDLQAEDEKAVVASSSPQFVSLPTTEVARTFSVESVDYPHPLGVHQVHRFQQTKLGALNEWCPEYKLCSAEVDRGHGVPLSPPPPAVVAKPKVVPAKAKVGGVPVAKAVAA